jgi:hypothetical protein
MADQTPDALIVCTTRKPDGSISHVGITWVLPHEPQEEHLAVADVAKLLAKLKMNTRREVDGKIESADVEPWMFEHLKTVPDKTKKNNLAELPKCEDWIWKA